MAATWVTTTPALLLLLILLGRVQDGLSLCRPLHTRVPRLHMVITAAPAVPTCWRTGPFGRFVLVMRMSAPLARLLHHAACSIPCTLRGTPRGPTIALAATPNRILWSRILARPLGAPPKVSSVWRHPPTHDDHQPQAVPVLPPLRCEGKDSVPAKDFRGAVNGFVFQLGPQGIGYYPDRHASAVPSLLEAAGRPITLSLDALIPISGFERIAAAGGDGVGGSALLPCSRVESAPLLRGNASASVPASAGDAGVGGSALLPLW